MPVICSAETDRAVVALTFDDGPKHPETDTLLDVLAAADAKATFFVRGGAIDAQTTPLVVRAARDGHEIGNHTHSHLRLDEIERATVLEEISRTHAQLEQLTGTAPTVIRPPYGVGLDLVDEIAAPLGYRATVGWSVHAAE